MSADVDVGAGPAVVAELAVVRTAGGAGRVVLGAASNVVVTSGFTDPYGDPPKDQVWTVVDTVGPGAAFEIVPISQYVDETGSPTCTSVVHDGRQVRFPICGLGQSDLASKPDVPNYLADCKARYEGMQVTVEALEDPP